MQGGLWRPSGVLAVPKTEQRRRITFGFPVRGATCPAPALAVSRGYPQDEQRRREKTRETSLDGAKSARGRERERKSDQTGGAAESGKSLFSTIAFIF